MAGTAHALVMLVDCLQDAEPGQNIMVMDVTYVGTSGIEFSEARVFYDGPFIPQQALTPRTYDAHPDGRLLLIERVDQNARADDIYLVLNWFEE